MLLIPHTTLFFSIPLYKIRSWVFLLIHSSPNPHSHYCDGFHCVCVSIFVWAKHAIVCVIGDPKPPPPPLALTLPVLVKERMRLEREEATRLLEEATEVRLYAIPVFALSRAPGPEHWINNHLEHTLKT